VLLFSALRLRCSGLFIIAPDGTLRQKTVNDLPVGRSVDETLRLVKAFQVGGPPQIVELQTCCLTSL
jgi:alkyl hydroperoxide reductase subunit AhpC